MTLSQRQRTAIDNSAMHQSRVQLFSRASDTRHQAFSAGWGETEAGCIPRCMQQAYVESCLTRFFLLEAGALVLCECLARAAQDGID